MAGIAREDKSGIGFYGEFVNNVFPRIDAGMKFPLVCSFVVRVHREKERELMRKKFRVPIRYIFSVE